MATPFDTADEKAYPKDKLKQRADICRVSTEVPLNIKSARTQVHFKREYPS
jgi:hypothetical protein